MLLLGPEREDPGRGPPESQNPNSSTLRLAGQSFRTTETSIQTHVSSSGSAFLLELSWGKKRDHGVLKLTPPVFRLRNRF